MGFADILDPVYITGAPKTFVLKLCIGLIVGLVAHRIAKINESTDKKYIFRWSMIASVAGLGFNVIADPIVGYFYKQYIMGQPQQMAPHFSLKIPVPHALDHRVRVQLRGGRVAAAPDVEGPRQGADIFPPQLSVASVISGSGDFSLRSRGWSR